MKCWMVSLVATALFSVSACTEEGAKDAMYGPVAYRVLPDEARGYDDGAGGRLFHAVPVIQGGLPFQAFDFGPVGEEFDAVYLLYRNGRLLEEQHPIFDSLPGDEGYNSLRRVVRVDVDDAYQPNDIKSLKTLESAFGKSMTVTNLLMNCPVVNPDASFIDVNDRPIQRFYGDGTPAANVRDDSASTPVVYDDDAVPGEVVLQPVWVRRLLGYCWSPQRSKRYAVTDAGFSEVPPRWNEFVSALPADDDVSDLRTGRSASIEATDATYFDVYAVVDPVLDGSGSDGSGNGVVQERSLGWFNRIVLPIREGGAQ